MRRYVIDSILLRKLFYSHFVMIALARSNGKSLEWYENLIQNYPDEDIRDLIDEEVSKLLVYPEGVE